MDRGSRATHSRTSRTRRLLRWTRLIVHLVSALVILRLVFPHTSLDRRRRLVGWWSRAILRILNLETVVEGPRPEASEACAMIVANHVSWVDVFFISSVRPTRFIAKSEVRDWPLVGWVADRAGTLFIRRERRRDTARINEAVHDAFARGDCVGFFPEGTTTMGDRLLKFHSSLFEPAIANNAHVHPAAIRYEYPDGTLCRAMAYGDLSFTESLGLILRQPRVTARIRFAAPIEAGGAKRREIAGEAEARIARLLGLPAPGTAPGTPPDSRGAPP